MAISFKDKVAIVTGAGGGLGRAHALALAKLGAKVVINDLGGALDGSGGSSQAAEKVVAEIIAAGGEAIANGASVSDDAGVAHLVKHGLVAQEVLDKQEVEIVYWNEDETFEHVLLPTDKEEVYIVVVVDLDEELVIGHHKLDLTGEEEVSLEEE